jgi:hypothetical protein
VQGEAPKIMRKIIHNNEIISKTRITRNRGHPNITMQQLKWAYSRSGGIRKREFNMFS